MNKNTFEDNFTLSAKEDNSSISNHSPKTSHDEVEHESFKNTAFSPCYKGKANLQSRNGSYKCGCLSKISFVSIAKVILIISCISSISIFLLKPLFISSADDVPLVKIEMPTKQEQVTTIKQDGLEEELTTTAVAVEKPLPVDSFAGRLPNDELPEKASTTTQKAVVVGKEEVLVRVLELEKLAKQNLAKAEKNKVQPQMQNPVPKIVSDNKKPDTVNNTNNKQVNQSTKVVEPSNQSNKTTTKGNYSKSEQQILQTADEHYTLQLLGVSQVKGIEQFMLANNLQGKAHYYRIIREKQPWYILIFGDYKTREEAKAAILQLPATVRALKPWVRDFASIKQNLQTRN